MHDNNYLSPEEFFRKLGEELAKSQQLLNDVQRDGEQLHENFLRWHRAIIAELGSTASHDEIAVRLRAKVLDWLEERRHSPGSAASA